MQQALLVKKKKKGINYEYGIKNFKENARFIK